MARIRTKDEKTLREIQERSVKALYIMGVLSSELTKGWRCYLVAKGIRQAWAKKSVKFDRDLFVTIHHSCEDTVFLTLTNLVLEDKRRKSANIEYFLDEFEAATNALTKLVTKRGETTIIKHLSKSDAYENTFYEQLLSMPRGQISQSIKQDRKLLGKLRSTVEKVVPRRHKRIAHLDRKQINAPDAILDLPRLNEKDTKALFQALFSMINTYGYEFLSPHLDPPEVDQEIRKDLAHLVDLIEADADWPI